MSRSERDAPVAGLVLRAAVPADAAVVFRLVSELAAYEKLAAEVVSSPTLLGAALFAERPRVFCELAEWDGEPVGLALWFYDFSTFLGRHGVYLEDLFVRPSFRGRGIGGRLLARLAARCIAEGLGRLTWSVLDWNQPAIDFYRASGAVLLDGWTACRVDGAALAQLARDRP